MENSQNTVSFSTLFARFIFWIIAIIVLGIFILTVIAIILEKKIAQSAADVINANISTNITYEAPSFSLIRGFPNATLTLNNVEVNASHEDKILLQAEKIKLKCNIFSLIFGNYEFHTIELQKGFAFLHKNQQGQSNYHILTNTTNNNNINGAILLEKIELTDFHVEYQDDYSDNTINIKATDLSIQNLSTHFQSRTEYLQDNLDKVYIYIKGSSIIEKMFLKGNLVFVNNEFSPSISTIYSPQDDMFSFEYAQFHFDGSKFSINGDWGIAFDEHFKNEISGIYTDIKITSNEVKFASLMALLPFKDKSRLNNWTSNNRGQIEFSAQGNFMKDLSPVINLKVQLFAATIQNTKAISPFSKLNLDLHYTNQAPNNSLPALSIKNFETQIAKNKIAFNFQQTGLDNPYIKFEGFANIPFNSLALIINDSLEHNGGLISIDSFYFEGAKNDFINAQEDKTKAYLSLKLKDLQSYYKNSPIFFEKGNMVLENQTLSIKDLSLQMEDTNLNIQGKIGNILAQILHKEQAKISIPFIFNLAASGQELDLDNLQNYLYPLLSKESMNNFLPKNTQGKLSLQVAQLNHRDINMNNVSMQLFMHDNNIYIQEANALWAKGNIYLTALFNLEKEFKYKLLCRLEHINWGQIMQESNNFSQKFLTNENLIGTVSATMYSEGLWNNMQQWSSKDFKLFGDLRIEDGYLTNYKPMVSIGEKLKIPDFKKIKIIDGYIQTSVANGFINYHQILLRSDGYNMIMNGRTSFENQLQAKFKFNTASVLLKNIQMHNTIPSPIKTYIPEMYNLYMQVQGNIGNSLQINYANPLSIEENLYSDKNKSLQLYFEQFQNNIEQAIRQSKTSYEIAKFPLQKVSEPINWINLSTLN